MRKAVLSATIMLVAGCATQQAWVHPTTGQANLATDRYRCEQDAARMYPPAYGQASPQTPQPTTSSTDCRVVWGQVQCQTRQNPPRQTIGGVLSEYAAQQDQNAGRRASAITSCLASMGYQYTTIESQSSSNTQTSSGGPTPAKPTLIREGPSNSAGLKVCEYSQGYTKFIPMNEQCDRYYSR